MNQILTVIFYRTTQGHEPVREWLQSLSPADRKILGEDLKTVQRRWPVGMPLVRPLGDNLWEVRSHLENRIVRLLFFIKDAKMILVHAFIKKTPDIPPNDLKLARKRKQEFLFYDL